MIHILGYNHSKPDLVKQRVKEFKKQNKKTIFFLEGDKAFDVSRFNLSLEDRIYFEGDTFESFLVQLIYAYNFVCVDIFNFYLKIISIKENPFKGEALNMYHSLPKEKSAYWQENAKTILMQLIKLIIDNLFITEEEKRNYTTVFEKILNSCSSDKIIDIPLKIVDFLRDKNMAQKISLIFEHHKKKFLVVIVGEKHGEYIKVLLEEMGKDVMLTQLF
jgi:hypothetical protein